MSNDQPETGVSHSPGREFGHARRGYVVEFNLNGLCACRTMTFETRPEAVHFKRMLENEENVTDAEVIRDA